MSKPINWKWKLVLGSMLGISFLVLYSLTDGANDFVVARMNEYYKDTPPDERRSSSWAGRWLFWSYFRGYTLGDNKGGYELYRDFLGLPKKPWAADVYFNPNPKLKNGTGKASADWQQGWGILHPDAADAFYDYICLMESTESGVNIARESKAYYVYLYDLHMKKSPDHQPHPKFQKYWVKVRQKILNGHVGVGDIPNYDFYAVKAKPWVEPKD